MEHGLEKGMDPAVRILADALLEVLGTETDEGTLFKLGQRMHEGSVAAVAPYFEGLSTFEKRACMIRAQQLARCRRS